MRTACFTSQTGVSHITRRRLWSTFAYSIFNEHPTSEQRTLSASPEKQVHSRSSVSLPPFISAPTRASPPCSPTRSVWLAPSEVKTDFHPPSLSSSAPNFLQGPPEEREGSSDGIAIRTGLDSPRYPGGGTTCLKTASSLKSKTLLTVSGRRALFLACMVSRITFARDQKRSRALLLGGLYPLQLWAQSSL